MVAISVAAQAPYVFKNIDIHPGGDSKPGRFALIGSTFYFAATTDASGTEPHITDGTVAGTLIAEKPEWCCVQ